LIGLFSYFGGEGSSFHTVRGASAYGYQHPAQQTRGYRCVPSDRPKTKRFKPFQTDFVQAVLAWRRVEEQARNASDRVSYQHI